MKLLVSSVNTLSRQSSMILRTIQMKIKNMMRQFRI